MNTAIDVAQQFKVELQRDSDKMKIEVEKVQNISEEEQKYSSRRFDILIISIAGGGIYIILESIKFILTNNIEVPVSIIKLVGVLFLLTILFNLFKQLIVVQFTGIVKEINQILLKQMNILDTYHNKLPDDLSTLTQDALKVIKLDAYGELDKLTEKSTKRTKAMNRWSAFNKLFHTLSIMSLMFALILLILFFWKIFPLG